MHSTAVTAAFGNPAASQKGSSLSAVTASPQAACLLALPTAKLEEWEGRRPAWKKPSLLIPSLVPSCSHRRLRNLKEQGCCSPSYSRKIIQTLSRACYPLFMPLFHFVLQEFHTWWEVIFSAMCGVKMFNGCMGSPASTVMVQASEI